MMMVKTRFNDVKALIAIGNIAHRSSVRTILQNGGFREIMVATSYDQIQEFIADKQPDVIVTSPFFNDISLIDLVRDIRHAKIPGNQFVPVITITDQPNKTLIANIIDSGSDDLLLIPISFEVLIGRIDKLIVDRKPFVVTAEYVGPCRRKASERPANIKTFHPPNVLELRVRGNMDSTVQREIDASAAEANIMKVQRHLSESIKIAKKVNQASAISDKQLVALERLFYVTGDCQRRIQNTRFAFLETLCTSITDAIDKLRLNVNECGKLSDEGIKAVNLLEPLTRALSTAFDSKALDTSKEFIEEFNALSRHQMTNSM